MKKILTKDNSITFYNEEAEDYYHSKSGAKEEAFEKYAKALDVKKKKSPVIFDICFGLGYNAAAALDVNKDARIYCFENDKEILKEILEIEADFKSYPLIKECIKQFLENQKTEYKNLIMVFGDAKETIKTIQEKADFVFFDPFSPARNQEMWTEKFFKEIYQKMNPEAKLSTYSCARHVRDNFKKAGFKITDGPIIGRTAPSTIAIK